MDVFTDFRRGKTIETQKLDPYTPAGSHLGQYAAGAAPAGYRNTEYFIMWLFTTRPESETHPSEFQQRVAIWPPPTAVSRVLSSAIHTLHTHVWNWKTTMLHY